MKDELHQLLLRADARAPTPALDVSRLPSRIRRTARNQRRFVACGLAILALSPLAFIDHQSPQPPAITSMQPTMSQLDADLHERTAALMQISESRPRQRIDPTDAFLADLQMQRNRAALVLLRDANRRLSESDPLAVRALRRTIELFPETPAAADATRCLRQIDLSREPS
jgi:hypothetical protein